MAEAQGNDSQSPGEDSRERARPEQVLEHWGRRAGRFLAVAASRVREEAEDIWAEAQSIKRGERE
ncbi:MAG: hypothetical protein JOZ98_12940 [Solirubrobacterales bacterium]|nr:hypothetical protein [Solirubrobacterales bacterium]MBV9797750.1 hypothetical protein [Solirubrobacterales bacterium]